MPTFGDLEKKGAPRVLVEETVLLHRQFVLFHENLLRIDQFPVGDQIGVTEHVFGPN